MAEIYTLEAQARAVTGKKVSQLRTQGLVPAVIYGSKTEPVSIQVPYRALELMLMKAGGTHLIDINVGGAIHSVLARAVQRDVIRRSILHVDFLAVDVNQPVRTQVPLRVEGESPALAGRLGILTHGITSLEIEALPADLIDSIVVDISVLKEVGDTITVGDLKVGSKVILHAEPEEVVARINPLPQAVTDEELDAETGTVEPELIRREREDEDEE